MVGLKDARYQIIKKLLGSLVADNLCATEAIGLANLPTRGPGLIVCNHRSILDPFLISARARRPIHWVMAPFVSSVPIFGWLAQQALAIPIIQGDEHKAQMLIESMIRVLKQGHLVGIFPEGMAGFVQSGGPCVVQTFRGTFIRAVLGARIPGLPVIPTAIYAQSQTVLGHVDGQLLTIFDRSERLFRSQNFNLIGYPKALIVFGKPESLDLYYDREHPKHTGPQSQAQNELVNTLSQYFHHQVTRLLRRAEARFTPLSPPTT